MAKPTPDDFHYAMGRAGRVIAVGVAIWLVYVMGMIASDQCRVFVDAFSGYWTYR